MRPAGDLALHWRVKEYIGYADSGVLPHGPEVPAFPVRSSKKPESSMNRKTSDFQAFLSLVCISILLQRHSRDKAVHEDKVAEASSHNEEVKDFMRAEILMPGVKHREL